jgi:hypothetical protein
VLSFVAGCKHDVDVAPINAEAESLQKNEADLLTRRGTLQRERKKLADERAELYDKRKEAKDPAGQAALDDEERKLVQKETDLASQESQINNKLDDLLKMRAELVQKATATVATASGADPAEHAARREQGVATREKDVARREADLAEREKSLAEREARQARREKEQCGGAALAIPTKIELPKGLKYTAHDVEPIYKKALKVMQERGLLSSDLPPGAAHLVEDTRDSMKKADYVRAKYEADQLLATIEEIKIDRGFIANKMARLSAAMKGKKLEGTERKNVEGLFQEATANYGDGKFGDANGKINKLFSLLK